MDNITIGVINIGMDGGQNITSASTRVCIRCGASLDGNIHPSDLKKRFYACKKCSNLRKKPYKTTDRYKTQQAEYRNTDEYQKHHLEYNRWWGNNTKAGKAKRKRDKARYYRNKGWTKLFENIINEQIEWHHIDNELVVAIPTDIHKLYNGYKHHKELCMNIINQLYL